MESYVLNNGMTEPVIGFGCYNAKGGDNVEMFKSAINNGYTLFDTASFYETERALGQAVRESGKDRTELIIQSKLWLDEMGYDSAMAAIERSLERIGTDYLDVYMIHWPRISTKSKPSEWKELQRDTYRALERMVEQGMIKAIGLSNFLPHHLDNILSICNIAPVVDQLEYHIGYVQEQAWRYASDKGIRVQAWSPLGRGSVLENDITGEMAERLGVSVSRLALRFIYQCGIIPLPKSASSERQKENLDVFNFEISDEDMKMLSCLPNTLWSGEHPDLVIPQLSSNFAQ